VREDYTNLKLAFSTENTICFKPVLRYFCGTRSHHDSLSGKGSAFGNVITFWAGQQKQPIKGKISAPTQRAFNAQPEHLPTLVGIILINTPPVSRVRVFGVLLHDPSLDPETVPVNHDGQGFVANNENRQIRDRAYARSAI